MHRQSWGEFHSGAAAAPAPSRAAALQNNEIRASEEIWSISMTKPLTSVNIFENFEFSRFRCHGPLSLVTYNFLNSQRQAVILSENDVQIPWHKLIYKLFPDSSFWIRKIEREHRKTIDRTTSIRQAIVPADAISLRCNHSTRHLN